MSEWTFFLAIIMHFSDEVCNAFNKQASHYNSKALAQCEIGNTLFERLSYLKINPKHILDLGCGTGIFTQKLKVKYPNAKVVGVDLARDMLKEASSDATCEYMYADMHALPFEDDAFDLVFSNQVLHWSYDYSKLISEVARVMRVGAALMFSTLGPDTFIELRQHTTSPFLHANHFKDMHDVGDILLSAHLLDPVMDMDKLTVHYKSFEDLVKSLKAQGARNMNAKRNPALTGKNAWQAFRESVETYKTEKGQYPLSYEVVYGHAWKSEYEQVEAESETSIALSAMRRMLRG